MKLAERTKPTKFIKLGNDHYGTGTGVTLIRKDTFNERQWEASYDSSYKNRYIGCLLDNFCDLMWPQMLDPEIKDCLVPVPIVVAEGNQVSTLHTIYRVGFALSCTEVGLSGWQTEGTAFAYFNSNDRRKACFDETNTAVYWGLRSPYSGADYAYYVNADGTLDRAALKAEVFADKSRLAVLEGIVHPAVKAELLRRAYAADTDVVIQEIPLYYESGCTGADVVVNVEAPVALRRARAVSRDKITEGMFDSIASSQLSDEERRARADVTIRADGDPADLYAQAEELLKKWRERSK